METPSSYRLAARLLAVALAGAAAALLAVPELPPARVPSAPPHVAPVIELALPNADRTWRVGALLIAVRGATGDPADPSQGAITVTINVDEDRRTRGHADF